MSSSLHALRWALISWIGILVLSSSPSFAAADKNGAPAAPKKAKDSVKIDLEDGLRVQTTDKEYAYTLGGRVQVDSHTYDYPASGLFGDLDPENHVFDIRRARLELSAKMGRYYTAKLSSDFANEVELKDAYINVSYWGAAQIRLGQFVYPYSTESIGSSKYQIFAESSAISSAVTSSRDRGLMVYGNPKEGRLFFQFAMMNGAKENTMDNNQDLDLALRVVWNPEEVVDDDWNFWAGAVYTVGDQTARDGDSIAVKTESKSGLSLFKAELPDGTDYVRKRTSLEFTAVNGPILFKGEFFRAEYSFVRNVGLRGAYLIASYFLTGEQHAVENGLLKRQAVDAPFDPEGDDIGAWEVAVRYSVFHADKKFFEADGLFPGWTAPDSTQYVNGGYTWAVGVNWYPDDMARVTLDWFQTYAADLIVNDISEARGSSSKAESTILLRFQLEF